MTTTRRQRRADDPERGRWRRRAPYVVLPALAAATALALAPFAHAEGPGYGGTADKLSVSWASVGHADQPPAPATAPSQSPLPSSTASSSSSSSTAGLGAAVTGGLTGGHGRSVAVPSARLLAALRSTAAADGASAMAAAASSRPLLTVSGVGFRGLSAVTVRVGTRDPLTVRVDTTGTLDLSIAAGRADSIAVGTSVVAIGRAPSGTTKTLVGAVPPRPTAKGPVDTVPWITVAVLLALGLSSLVTRLRARSAESLVPHA